MAFVALGTGEGSSSGTQLTVGWPAGHAANQIGILVVVERQAFGDPGVATLATANNFAAVTGGSDLTTDGTWYVRTTKFWCRASSGSMSSPVVAAGTGNMHSAVIITFDGRITTGDPTDGTPGLGANASSNNSVTAPGPTTSVADCDVLIAIGYMTAVGTGACTNANLSSITERMDANPNGVNAHITLVTAVMATAGDVGNTTATLTGGETWNSVVIALRPEPQAVDGGGGRPRPRQYPPEPIDIRLLARLRAQASNRPRDLRLISHVHAPDGYARGEQRGGVGSGYLSDIEDRGVFVPYAERIADMGRTRPRMPALPQQLRRSTGIGASPIGAIVTGEISVSQTPNPVNSAGGTVTGFIDITLVGDQTDIAITLLWQPNPYVGGMSDSFLDGFTSTGWIAIGGDVYSVQYYAASKLAGNYQIAVQYGPINLNPSRQVQLSVSSAYSAQVAAFTQNPGTSTIEVD